MILNEVDRVEAYINSVHNCRMTIISSFHFISAIHVICYRKFLQIFANYS